MTHRDANKAWSEIEALLDAALTLPAPDRAAYLAAQTGSDPEILAEVERLLAAADTRRDLLDQPAAQLIRASGIQSGLPAGTRLGAYRVIQLIGRGGMGDVYRAERADGVFRKEVAAKVLRADAAQHLSRFESERQVVANLDHPGIARLLDGGVSEHGRPYMVMEYVAGLSLTEHVRQSGPGLDDLLALFLQICDAVSFAHERGVIHRDLKPANILVTAEGRTKLLDFGVAKIIDPLAAAPVTATVAPLTVAYSAPEQLQGKAPTTATDVHALGLVLYELLTGRLPWRNDAGTPIYLLMHRVLTEEAPPAKVSALPSIPSALLQGALAAILSRCLKKNPVDRYSTVSELARDLTSLRRGDPLSATTTGAGRQTRGGQAERKQLTVLFCDLVDSTVLSDQLDPEAFRDLVMSYQEAVGEVVVRYAGHVAQYLGDGMLIYFGFPQTQEDDAERAVRCGYDILQALTRLNRQPSLQARIGIHTGPVVIGQMGGAGRTETLAMGVTTNLAARLLTVASPHSVVISEATLKLVPGLFITQSLGPQLLKGIDKPLRVFQVIQPSGIRSRLEAAENLTPFVGRTQEVALLGDRWEQACEGRGQVVLLTAEPGLGKSRLLLILRDRVRESTHTWLESRCMSMERNSAFGPIVELLERGLRLNSGDDIANKIQILENVLDLMGADRQESIPLLGPLFSLTLPATYPPSPYGPEMKRKKLLALLSRWTLELARQQPVLLVVEDLHWADPSTLDVIGVLIDQLPSHRVLLVLTARPEFHPSWPIGSHTSHLSLQALRATEASLMLANLAGDQALPSAVAGKILERAGGVPLFLEEITRSLMESGQALNAPERVAIPATLQDSLNARIDRLGDAKTLLQLCAVIGREIPYALLLRVVETDESALLTELRALTQSQLLYHRRSPPETVYLFKHALIQDAAYGSLLSTTKQKQHLRIATALEQHFKNRVKAEPAVLAAHFEQSGQIEKAVKYYQAAAKLAGARAAATEAIAFLDKGLALVRSLAEGVARDRHEVSLLAELVTLKSSGKGYAHPETRALLERAREMLPVANPAPKGIIMGWLGPSYFRAGEYEKAAGACSELVAFGKQVGLSIAESFGHMQIAFPYCSLGRFEETVIHCDESLRFLSVDLETARLAARNFGQDPLACSFAMKARALWPMGRPDEALRLAHQAIARAEAIDTPLDWGVAMTWGLHAILRLRREPEACLQASLTAKAHCERYGHGDGLWDIAASAGLANAWLGRLDEGVAMLRHSIVMRRDMGTVLLMAWDWCDMAAVLLAGGRVDEARTALQEAFAVMERYNERFWEAELHRVDGELRLAESKDEAAAQACFQRALDVSRRQNARMLELRASASLARLWQGQGYVVEAHDLLQSIHAWFTEGFETPDLTQVRALLDQIGALTLVGAQPHRRGLQ